MTSSVTDKKKQVALSLLLWDCVTVLRQIETGGSGREAFGTVLASHRAAVQALVFQMLRNWGRARYLVGQLASKRPKPDTRLLLEAVLALLSSDQGAPYEVFTLLNQAVECCKQQRSLRGADGFVNACLRQYVRSEDALRQRWSEQDTCVWNFPAWWIDRVRQDHPQTWQSLLQASNQAGPLTLRVNAQRTSADDYASKLQVPHRRVGAVGVELFASQPVEALPGYDEGEFSVQDAGAQLAASLLLNGTRPERVLDACAAPGGKTGHLLEAGVPEVLALEKDPYRAQRIGENLARLHLQAQVVVADAGQPESWWDGRAFDAILLDAPCSASGIVRRHPDVRWLRRESDIAALAQQQRRLLQQLWPLLRPGGRMLYCTCSVFRQEGSEQIEWFLAQTPAARLLDEVGHLLPQAWGEGTNNRSQLGSHDGFYYALLVKD